MKELKIVTVPVEEFDDDYTCECGNTVTEDGFFPCNSEGEIIEPIKGLWDGLYVCQRCETVIKLKEEDVK